MIQNALAVAMIQSYQVIFSASEKMLTGRVMVRYNSYEINIISSLSNKQTVHNKILNIFPDFVTEKHIL